jgi:uncharacterized protein YndB with AHSA1/START domain
MHGPDGRDYPNEIVFVEIAKPERLVYDHVSEPKFQTTVTFTEHAGKTEVTARMLFESAKLRNWVAAEHGAVEGLHQTLERLAEQLIKMPAEQGFVITRVFDAPRDLVWKALTESERFHYAMRAPDGGEMWGKWVYREIVPPERLVFVNSFSDEAGNVVRAPFNANWPLEILNVVTLSEHAGRTTITMRGGPINATEEERRTFHAARQSMEQGFGGTFNQLDAYLASEQGATRS